MQKKGSLSSNQKGFASLVIAIVLVIVLGLLTVGFAELMRHSQEQELNRHLSDQAYYAAESGINDAIRAINNGYEGPKTDCGPLAGGGGGAGAKYLTENSATNGSNSISAKWTCLLINPTPSSLAFNPVDTVNPRAAVLEPINPTNGHSTDINRIDIYWQGTDNSTDFRNNYSFPSVGSWHSVGMLRVGLTPLSSFSRSNLIDNTYTAFLYPSEDSTANNLGTETYKSGDDWTKQGDVIKGHCNPGSSPRYCHIEITGVTPASKYLLSLRSIYSPTSVYVVAHDSSGAEVSFKDAQTMIDSTGRSHNVLKRLQVRVPNRKPYPYPGFVAETAGDICKELDARPGSVSLSC